MFSRWKFAQHWVNDAHDEFQNHTITYLDKALKPKVVNPSANGEDEVDLIAIFPPGTMPKG